MTQKLSERGGTIEDRTEKKKAQLCHMSVQDSTPDASARSRAARRPLTEEAEEDADDEEEEEEEEDEKEGRCCSNSARASGPHCAANSARLTLPSPDRSIAAKRATKGRKKASCAVVADDADEPSMEERQRANKGLFAAGGLHAAKGAAGKEDHLGAESCPPPHKDPPPTLRSSARDLVTSFQLRSGWTPRSA
jgi:hypothetical protein